MLTLFRVNKKKKGITLVEVMISITILGLVGAMVSHWFSMNTGYQKRLTKQNDCDNNIRKILWSLHQEAKTARTILYPRLEKVKDDRSENLISDSKVVFRNFEGDIISYFYEREKKELVRVKSNLPTQDSPASVEKTTVGKEIDKIIFTNRNEMNNLLGIYMESGPSVMLDSVFLMNE